MKWKKIFQKASVNRLLFDSIQKNFTIKENYSLSLKETQLFDALHHESLSAYQKTVRTYSLWKEIAERLNINYRIIKTDKQVFEIPNDIDILVEEKDFSLAQTELSKYIHKKNIHRKEQTNYQFQDFIQIDLHTSESRGLLINGTHLMEKNLIWENPEKFKVGELELFKPNPTAEFGIILLNTLFGHFYISANDKLWFEAHKDNIDWLRIGKVAKQYGWVGALELYLNKIEGSIESFPNLLSFKEVAKLYLEKAHSLIGFTKIDRFNWFYFTFAKVRFSLSGGLRVPIYGHWTQVLK